MNSSPSMPQESPETHEVRAELHWRASPLALALATCVGVTLVAALIASRWQLIVFAAPLVGVLCSIGWQGPLPTLVLRVHPSEQRCFEAEPMTLRVSAAAGNGQVRLTVTAEPPMELEVRAGDKCKTVVAQSKRWGRYPITARAEVLAPGGLMVGTASVDVAELFVFPLAPPQSVTMPRIDLLDRLGIHLTRHTGPGVEFAAVRAYVPGDQVRAVNWPVSARRGSLHVTQRLTERAADVVVLIDTSIQPAGAASAAAERMVYGAVQVVQSALRYGDRAGIVVLSGRRPRWLGPDIGRRQFYRVVDTVLGLGDQFNITTGTLAPRAAVPARAIVVAFSTLLDTEFALALIDLSKRGHRVIAVDLLDAAPFDGARDPLIDRLWRLERSFMYRDMGTIGVDVVQWPSGVTLDEAARLAPDRYRPRPVAR